MRTLLDLIGVFGVNSSIARYVDEKKKEECYFPRWRIWRFTVFWLPYSWNKKYTQGRARHTMDAWDASLVKAEDHLVHNSPSKDIITMICSTNPFQGQSHEVPPDPRSCTVDGEELAVWCPLKLIKNCGVGMQELKRREDAAAKGKDSSFWEAPYLCEICSLRYWRHIAWSWVLVFMKGVKNFSWIWLLRLKIETGK